MKFLISALLALALLSACKKDKTVPVTPPIVEYPENWGMMGTIGDDNFTATSLNASLIHDTLTNTYVLNVNGWNRDNDQIIYLSYKNFTFTERTYLVSSIAVSQTADCYAFYEKDHVVAQFGAGTISIHSASDTLIKGSYNYTTTDHVTIKGVYTIKPHLAYQ